MCIRNTVLLSSVILLAGIIATVLFVRISSQKEIKELFTTLIPIVGALMFILIPSKILLLNATIEQRAGYYLTDEKTERLAQTLASVDYKTEESFTDALAICVIIDVVFEVLYFIVTAAIAQSVVFTTMTLITVIFSIAGWLMSHG